ncbi:MAG TPA: POTRA domain-containing protein [Bacteroidota bacterium]|nr:POTRA domain-containing protein [Bacteroidota bacterium]
MFLAVAVFLTSQTLYPGAHPVLLSLKFSGNEAVSSGDLRDVVPLRPGDDMTDSALRRAVSAVTGLYRERSYYGAVVIASPAGYTADSSGADLLVSVREGVPATIGRIEFRGVRAFPEDRASGTFGGRPGDPLTPGRLQEGLAALLTEYERLGFPFARASIDGISGGDDGAMTVIVGIGEGESVAVGEIRIEGNTETDRAVILRESRMELPEPFDPGKVSRFAQRLRRLGLFTAVGEPSLYATPAGHGLLVRVSEGRTNTFDGAAGYAPPRPGESGGSIAGRAAVAMRNLFGTGRKMEAEWSRDGRSTQEIRLSYDEPWAFGLPVNLGVGFSQRQQDSSFVDRRVSAAVEFLASSSFSVAAVGERKRIIPSLDSRGAGGAGGAGMPGSTATTGGIVVRYDTRDDRELPRSGVNYRSEYRTGTRTPAGGSPGAAAGSVRHLEFDIDLFIPLRETHVVNLAVHGREVSTASAGPGDLYRIGGFRTLRGFRENHFSGARVAWGTAEYRVIVEGKSFFYGFFDPGYVASPPPAGDFFTFGYGAGMRLETGLGLIGVSFALGKGDPVSETKIHFGLINDF